MLASTDCHPWQSSWKLNIESQANTSRSKRFSMWLQYPHETLFMNMVRRRNETNWLMPYTSWLFAQHPVSPDTLGIVLFFSNRADTKVLQSDFIDASGPSANAEIHTENDQLEMVILQARKWMDRRMSLNGILNDGKCVSTLFSNANTQLDELCIRTLCTA